MERAANLLNWARANSGAMVDFLRQLIAIPSPPGKEQKLARRLKAELEGRGFDEVWIDGIGNVVARIRGKRPRAGLLFNGHMDHVFPGIREHWAHDPYTAVVVGGSSFGVSGDVVRGRGAGDMKGWIATICFAGSALKSLGIVPEADILFSFVVQEESRADGIRYLFEMSKLEVDFALVGEASGLNIMLGHRGNVEVWITVVGRIGHGAIPSNGVNAISAGARLVGRIESMPMPADPVFGRGTLCVDRIDCGDACLAIVPDTCNIHVLRKIVPAETCEGVMAEFERVCEEFRQDNPDVKVELRLDLYHPPMAVSREDPRVAPRIELLRRVAREVCGADPKLSTWQFGTDGFYIHEIKGIPTIGFGPGNEWFAHTPLDHIPVEDMLKACAIYAAFAAEFR